VIAEWDRATRSMWDGLQIPKEIIDAEATIPVLGRVSIELTSPIGRGFMAFISFMAEDERLRIIKRTHEGRAIARENGVKMGRKFRLNDVQPTEARRRLANGEAASHLAKVCGVSRARIYRARTDLQGVSALHHFRLLSGGWSCRVAYVPTMRSHDPIRSL
jgi:DNA invertase Pin-like site-specific DNA recombinase